MGGGVSLYRKSKASSNLNSAECLTRCVAPYSVSLIRNIHIRIAWTRNNCDPGAACGTSVGCNPCSAPVVYV